MIQRYIEEKDIRTEGDWWRRITRDREDNFFCISFPDSFDAKNISVYNEYHYELTFLSMVLSTLTARTIMD